MKNTIIIVTLLFASLQLLSQEEDTSEKILNDVFTVSPGILFGDLSFQYERAFSYRSAVQIRGFYDSDDLRSDQRSEFQSYQIGIHYKYYMFKKRNRQQGLYIFGGANYRDFESKATILNFNNDVDLKSPYLEIGLGYQFVFNKFLKGLTLDIDLSQEYAIPLKSIRDFSGRRTLATSRISIGYSF